MNAKMKKRRVWAAVLSIAAVFALVFSGVETPKMQSVYAASDDDKKINGAENLEVGKSYTYDVKIMDDNSDPETWSSLNSSKNNNINWSVEDPSNCVSYENIAHNAIKITANKPGRITITATQKNFHEGNDAGSKTKTKSVTINAVSATALNILDDKGTTVTSATIAFGATQSFTIKPSPENAALSTLSVSSSSKNVSVTKPDASGKFSITGNAGGSAIITVTNGSITASLDITVTTPSGWPSITTESLPDGTVGLPYTVTTLKASGSNVTWTASGLPSGLSLTQSGEISGTPSREGTYDVIITATNSNGSASETFKLQINPMSQNGVGNVRGTIQQGAMGRNSITSGSINNFNDYLRTWNSYVSETGDSYYFEMKIETLSEDTPATGKSNLNGEIEKYYGGIKDKKDIMKNWFLIDRNGYRKLKNETSYKRIDANLLPYVLETEINIPYIYTNIRNLGVFRYHEGDPQRLYRVSKKPSQAEMVDRTFYVDEDAGKVYIYSSKFSLYAITYPSADLTTYLVSFLERDGRTRVYDDVVVEAGQRIPEPSKPADNSFGKFQGWSESASATTDANDWKFTTALNSSHTDSYGQKVLYARRGDNTSNPGGSNSGNSGNSGSTTNRSTTGGTGTGNTPSGTTAVNSPQTSDPIDYVRAFAAMIVVCAGTLVLLYALKVRRRK